MSTFLILYLVVFRPLDDPKQNKIEIFTEICILFFIYCLLGFTDYVKDAEAKSKVGAFAIGIFFLNILVSLLSVVRD
jgi:hypothetical protein